MPAEGSQKSFRPKDGSGNDGTDFHGQKVRMRRMPA